MANNTEQNTLVPVSSKPKKFDHRILILIIFILFIVGIKYQLLTESTIESQLVSQTDPTAGWHMYTNTKYGYEFKYPNDVGIVNEETSEYVGPPTNPQEDLLLISDKEKTFHFQINEGILYKIKESPLGDQVLSTLRFTNPQASTTTRDVFNVLKSYYPSLQWSNPTSTNISYRPSDPVTGDILSNSIMLVGQSITSNTFDPYKIQTTDGIDSATSGKKLNALGWKEDINNEADGPGSYSRVYINGNQYMQFLYNTDFLGTAEDAPVSCPCQSKITIFVGKKQ